MSHDHVFSHSAEYFVSLFGIMYYNYTKDLLVANYGNFLIFITKTSWFSDQYYPTSSEICTVAKLKSISEKLL